MRAGKVAQKSFNSGLLTIVYAAAVAKEKGLDTTEKGQDKKIPVCILSCQSAIKN